MLGNNGPNVNKTVWAKVNEAVNMISGGRPGATGLVDIGHCNLHVVHNAFGKGLSLCGNNISDLIIDVRVWFKLSAARREDFSCIQRSMALPLHMFLKHVECRWLTLLPALDRLLEQWKALCHYFLEFLPKQQPSITENARFKRIRNQLLRKDACCAEIHFLKSVAELFTSFLRLFQKEEPLIHILYDQLVFLTRQLLSRFVKKSVLDNCASAQSLTRLDVSDLQNQLDNSAIEVGEEARRAITSFSLENQKKILFGIRKFLAASATYLLKKLSTASSSFLGHCSALQPLAQKKDGTIDSIKKIARKLPIEVNIDGLGDEWRAYQCEDIPEEWCANSLRIDHYWRNVCQLKDILGEIKYPTILKFVKAVLILSHGNSAVERGFSESGKSIKEDRVKLSESSIRGILATNDGLKRYDSKPHLVPITSELLRLGRSAHSHYVQRLEKEKEELRKAKRLSEADEKKAAMRLQELAKSRDDIKKQSTKLEEKETRHQEDLDVGNTLLTEATLKLKHALKKKDLKMISLAQSMIEAAQNRLAVAHKKLGETREKQKKIEKKKQGVLDTFLEERSRKKTKLC